MSEQISVPTRTAACRIVALRWTFAYQISRSVPSGHRQFRVVR